VIKIKNGKGSENGKGFGTDLGTRPIKVIVSLRCRILNTSVMKNHNESKSSPKEFQNILDAIELLIKSDTYREIGNELLGKFDTKILSPKQLAHYQYLNARYHVYMYRKDKDLEDLEYANDFLDEMTSSAFNSGYIIKDVRYLFTRAHTKYELAKTVWEEERKPWLLEKARHITQTALRFNPENSSFIWLQEQLVD